MRFQRANPSTTPELWWSPTSSPDISPNRLSRKRMSFFFNHVRRFFGNPAGYKLRWPRPRTVGSGHGRSRRRRPWGTFARMRARARSTIRRGYASVSSLARAAPSRCLFLRGLPPRAPRLKAPSTRTRAKSCAIIAALDEISGLAGSVFRCVRSPPRWNVRMSALWPSVDRRPLRQARSGCSDR